MRRQRLIVKFPITPFLLASFLAWAPALHAAESAAPAAAGEFSERHLALARELVDLVNPRGAADMQLRILAEEMRGNPQTANYADLFRDWVANTAQTEALANDIARMYAEHFSPAELKDILRFYQTDTGKKVIAAMPVLAEKSIRLGEEWAFRQAPSLIEKIRERQREEAARAAERMAVPPPATSSF
jgi:hypothetical protein